MYRTALRRAVWAAAPVALVTLFVLTRSGARAQDAPAGPRLGRQEVSVEIDDRQSLAVTTVRQEWINSASHDQQASFLLPISDDAALLRYEVTHPARKAGESKETRGSLEVAGRNLYRASVTRVPGKGRAWVELVYAEALTRRGRRRKYIYPIPAPDGGNAARSLGIEVRIRAASAPLRVQCATHPMTLRRTSGTTAALIFATQETPDGRDLVVDYELPASVDDTQGRLSVYTPPDGSRDPFFLLTLPPPAALLRDNRALDQPADILFCMDISGSTRGRKLDAIQEAVRDGLSDLSPRDRFGVIAFDDDSRAFRRTLTPATPGAVGQAIRWVSHLRPGAGSDPERALRAAAELLEQRSERDGRRAFVAMVVDRDDPSNLTAGAAALRLRSRLVRLSVFGALSDSRLVDVRVAGSRLQSGSSMAFSRAAITFGPGLNGASFDAGSLNASYLSPAPEKLPSLPLSTPILVFGRLNQPPPERGTVSLTGMIEGKRQVLQVGYLTQRLPPDSPVPALWSNRRIRRLYQLAARERDDAEELLDAVDQVKVEGSLAEAPAP